MKAISKKKIQGKLYYIIIVAMIAITTIVVIAKTNGFYKAVDRTKNIERYSYKENGDIKSVGWIRVQGTDIDYPVIDNSNMVIDTIPAKENFAWIQGTEHFSNKITVLGHNIKNVSSNPLITEKSHTRFEQLMSYIYYDFVADNKYIEYSCDGKNYLYKIYAISIVKSKEIDYKTNYYDEEEIKKYIKKSKDESIFDFSIDVDEKDNILTLVTCTRFGGRKDYDFKIDARMVRKNESVNNYQVKKNDNYVEIEKILRGEESENIA